MKDLPSSELASTLDGIDSIFSQLLPDTGAQPLISEDGKTILAVNGEIYNHIALRNTVGPDVKFKTHSDCEVILALVSVIIMLLVFAPYRRESVQTAWHWSLQSS